MQIQKESFQKNPQSPRRIRHLLPALSSRTPHTHELNRRILPLCVVSASFPPFHRARPGDTRTIHSDSRLNAPCEIPSVRSSLLTARASVRPPGVSRRANRSDRHAFVRSDPIRSFVRSRRRGYVPSSSSGGMEGGVDVAPGSEGGAAGPNCVDARHLHLGPLHLKVIYRYVYVLYDTVGSSDIWMPARERVRTDGWVDSFVTRETTRRYRVVVVVFVSFSLWYLVVLQRGGASRRAV
jgi:hypothetical protein